MGAADWTASNIAGLTIGGVVTAIEGWVGPTFFTIAVVARAVIMVAFGLGMFTRQEAQQVVTRAVKQVSTGARKAVTI